MLAPVGLSESQELELADARAARRSLRVLVGVAFVLLGCTSLVVLSVLEVALPWNPFASANPNRHAVFGSITLDGRPLEEGTICFRCQMTPMEETESDDIEAEVRAGAYVVPQHKGPVAGVYLVQIQWERGSSGGLKNQVALRVEGRREPIRLKRGQGVLIQLERGAEKRIDFEIR